MSEMLSMRGSKSELKKISKNLLALRWKPVIGGMNTPDLQVDDFTRDFNALAMDRANKRALLH